jgi:ABC-type polysaccharide/polyol phosphate export permease
MLRELVDHRDLLYLLVLRDLRTRYARAALGFLWALFLPAATLGIFVMLGFERLIPREGSFAAVPYAAFAMCGIVPWTHFAASLSFATTSLTGSRDLLKKSAFPREVIPIARPLAALVDLLIGAALVAALLAFYGWWPQAPALAVPFVFALQFAFTVGVCLVLAAANLFFRDVQYLVQVGLLLGMFVTSVLYPVEVRAPVARAVLAWNPMSSYIGAYRDALLLHRWPGPALAPGAIAAAVSLIGGVWLFRRLAPRFAEEA